MFRKTLYLQWPSSEPPDNSLLRALLLLSVPPFYAGITESASRITRFVLAAIITDSSAAIICGWPLKFLVGFWIHMFWFRILKTVDLSDQFYVFAQKALFFAGSMYFSHLSGWWGDCRPDVGKLRSWPVITIIPHLQSFFSLTGGVSTYRIGVLSNVLSKSA